MMDELVKKIGEIDLANLISNCKEQGWLEPIDDHDESPKTFKETKSGEIDEHLKWPDDSSPKAPLNDTVPEFIQDICEMFNAQMFRVMCLPPISTLDYHDDFNNRVNIPLITNNSCFYIFDDILFKLPADGSVYLTKTTVKHTAINGSYDYRFHLIGYTDNI